mmetsp:Transcript_47288/g.143212  ORF Transcript_47288/g.143212 Transcript_47288/m.143212 type:complete len:95 (-) Transcript_47288:7-291(-)
MHVYSSALAVLEDCAYSEGLGYVSVRSSLEEIDMGWSELGASCCFLPTRLFTAFFRKELAVMIFFIKQFSRAKYIFSDSNKVESLLTFKMVLDL